MLDKADKDLAEMAAPKVAAQILAQVEATPEERLWTELEQAGCWACCRHDETLFPPACATPPTCPGR